MEDTKVILYIHGMGGGADSRIPSILSECMPEGLEVVVRTYDFDPEIAREQISSWIARTCIRASIDRLRKRRRETLFLEAYAQEHVEEQDQEIPP